MKTKREIIYLAGFLFSVPVALTTYINSSFLELYTSEYKVGIVYIIASLLSIVGLIEMPRFLTRYGNRKFAIILSSIAFFSFISLSLSRDPSIIILSFIIGFAAATFLFASLDVFLEDFSTHIKKGASIGRFRGWYLMIINSAWVLAQLISGSIIDKSSYSGIYLFSSIFTLLPALIFIFFLKNFKDPIYKKVPIARTVRIFTGNKNLSRIYLLNFILKFFFAWMIIYTPIYLHEHIGFAWDQIGIVFTIMLLPFVILSFPLGYMSDKMGEKKLLMLGFTIAAFFTSLIPMIKVPTIWMWALILFMTRVGAAIIEVMSESYFFKSVDEENAPAISFFRNTGPLSFIIAPLVALPTLYFIPHFEFLFFILGAILLLGLFVSLRLKDVRQRTP